MSMRETECYLSEKPSTARRAASWSSSVYSRFILNRSGNVSAF
jgi:hypothetical protein